ncbi:FG-GAP repeat domain-containing protein [Actinomycetota bacterium Odt1-20B]
MKWHAPGAALCCAVLLSGCGLFTGGEPDGAAAPAPSGARPAAGKPAKSGHPVHLKDLNGDGYDDFAGPLASREHGTSLVVVYGSKGGLHPGWHTTLPGGGPDSGYGSPLRADLDGDGFPDLVAPRQQGEKVETLALYGGPRGVSQPRRLSVPDAFRPTAAGDFDGDGNADLTGGRTIQFGPFEDGRPARTGRVSGDHGAAQSGVTGDFDGDGRTDALFTYPYDADDYEQNDDPPDGPPQTAYFRGGPQGLTRASAEAIGSAMGGYEGAGGATAGDVDGDGIDDLVVSPGPGDLEPGTLTLFYGSKSGPGKGRSPEVLQGRGSTWGSGTEIGDVTGDGRADLLTGRPGFHLIDPDRLILLPASAKGGFDVATGQTVSGDDKGLPDGVEAFRFGAQALLDADGDGRQDVVAFTQRHDKEAGLFLVFPGGPDGLDMGRVRHFGSKELGVRLGRP